MPSAICQFHDGMRTQVGTGDGKFAVKQGLLQGGVIELLLFNIFMQYTYSKETTTYIML